jgi:hypothetical protein
VSALTSEGLYSDIVAEFLPPCPVQGSGIHTWIYASAHRLKEWGATEGEAIEAIRDNLSADRPDREICEAVRNAYRSETRPVGPRWPNPNLQAIRKVVEKGDKGLRQLEGCSPVPLGDLQAEGVIDALFPESPLLCFATKPQDAGTRGREYWRGRESQYSFMVPNPMTGRWGINQSGKPSARCLTNTGNRRYLVVEFDFSQDSEAWAPLLDDWEKKGITVADANAALLADLATNDGLRLPLVLAVYSGNKSLHGWFYANELEDDRLLPFMRRAVSLGGDRIPVWNKCQLVRVPGGLRDNGRHQTIHYFDPGALRAN